MHIWQITSFQFSHAFVSLSTNEHFAPYLCIAKAILLAKSGRLTYKRAMKQNSPFLHYRLEQQMGHFGVSYSRLRNIT